MRAKTLTCVLVLIAALLTTHSFAEREARQRWVPFHKLSREKRREIMRQRYIKRFEPSGKVHISRLPYYIDTYGKINIFDRKTTYFKVDARAEGEKIVLEGEVDLPEYKTGLEQTLNFLGFETIENKLKVLPDESLSATPFALVTTYTLPLYREPQRLSEQVNQVFLGRTVRLLKPSDKGDYVLCEAPGGYIGWAPVQVIKRINATEVKQWRLHYPRFLFTAEYVQKSGKATINIPMGADLPIIAKNRPTALTEQTVLLPDGRRLNVPVHYGRIINPEPEKARAKLLDIVKKLKDTPYVWGGISIKGLDCSGFTNLIYRLRGVPLPRDADQQSAVGEIVAFRGFRQGLLPGDLLFFASRFGRISHMAVSLGGDEFAHSHRNGVHIASFNPSQENYNEELDKRFVFARRILIDGF